MQTNQLLVIDIQGSAGVVLDDGSIRSLNLGDKINVGDLLVTATNSSVSIDVQGETLSIPANQRVKITPDLIAKEGRELSETTVFDESIEEAITSLDSDVDQGEEVTNNTDMSDFLDALKGDGDILDNLDATAAGGAANRGAGGGNSFVQLTRIAESVDPNSLTFDTTFEPSSFEAFSLRDTSDGVVPDTAIASISLNDLGITNSSQPTITGTSENLIGETVNVTVTDVNGNSQVVSVVIGPDGSFEITLPTSVADGPVIVVVEVTDPVGNSINDTISIQVDTTPPFIAIDPVADSASQTVTVTGTVSGLNTGDNISVTLTDSEGTVQIVVTQIDAQGNWSITTNSPVSEGEFNVSAVAVDAAGNQAFDQAIASVDLTAPRITVTVIADTNDTTPTFLGRVEGALVDSVITVVVTDINGNVQTLTTLLNEDGTWSVEANEVLPSGEFTVVASVADTTGNQATAQTNGEITFAPISIQIDAIANTNDTTPFLSGNTSNVPAGKTITLTITTSDGSTFTLLAVTQEDGSWTAQVTTPLPEGDFSVVAAVIDNFGNAAQASAVGNVDLTVSINFIIDTNDTTPTISGSTQDLEPGALVTVTFTGSDGISETVQVITGADGSWAVEANSELVEGQFSVVATVTDAAGNTASASETGEIDLTAPTITINTIEDTNNVTPSVSGNVIGVPAGSEVILVVTDSEGNQQTLTTTTNTDGTYTADIIVVLSEGNFTVTATVSDTAGNSGTVTVIGAVDLTAPSVTINNIADTNDTTPTLTGSTQGLEPGSVINIIVTDSAGTEQQLVTTISDDGTWSIEVSITLSEGEFTVTANVSDNAGNVAQGSQTGTVDTTAPIITINNFVDSTDITPIFSGTVTGVAPGTLISVLVVDVNGGSQTLTTIVLGNGTWQVGATQALAEGDFTITATIIDAAGNEASNMSVGTINLNPVNLSINTIETDNDTTPIVTGDSDLEVGSEVTITFTDSNSNVHSVVTQVGANGEWAVSAQEVLAEGAFSVTVSATDAAGNNGSATSTGETDYTGPVLAIDPLVGVLGVVTGVSGRSDLPPGSEVTVTQQLVGGGVAVLGVTTTDANGDWNLIGLNIALLNLANVSAEAQDAYGNSTTATLAWTDNTPPVLDVTINALSNDSSPVVSGTTDIGVGKKVIVTFTDKVGVSYVEEAIVDSNGNFSVAVSAVLPEGSYSVKVVAVDASGLVTEVLGAGVIDSVAPILTLDVLGTQGDATPLISGTSTEPVGSKVSVMVTDATNTPYLYEATVVAGGTWSIEVTDGLVNGVFSVTINASDSAGNPAVAVTSTGVINLSLPVIDITPLMVSNNTSPIIEGSSGLAQGTVVTLTVSQVGEADQVITVIVDANGNWTTQAGDISGLVEGNFNINVSAEDGVGNSITSNHSASIDLTDPLLTINAIETDNDTTPNVTGGSDLEVGSEITVTFTDSNSNVHSVVTQVGANGEWAVSAQEVLAEGAFSVTVSATDAAGNNGSATSTGETDYTGPVLAIDPLVGVLGVVTGVSGRSDLPPGSEVTVTQQLVGGGVAVLGVTTTDANGDWNLIGLNIALLNLANVSAEAQDAYGNSTTATLAWTDNTPPVLDVTINALSNDSSPVVSGTTDIGVGKKVIVTFTDKVGVSYVEEAIVDSNGNFSVAVSAVLPEGSYSVKVVAVDASGLVTEVLGAGVIDSVAPILTLDVLGTQGDATPLISGTSTEPVGSKVSVMVTDATNTPYLYEATVVAGGTWSIEVTDGLVNGVFSVTINASDSAGNPAVAVTSTGVINLSLPVIDITPLMVSNNTSPIIEGSSGLAQGTVVTLTVSQVGEADQVITVIVDANGNWTTQAGDISGLVEGNFNINVSAEDGVGNSITSNHSASIDLTDPLLTINAIETDNDTTPNVTGGSDLEVGSEITVTFTDSNSNVHSVVTQVGANGEWAVSAQEVLAEGAFSVTVSATDAAGNNGSATSTGETDYTGPVLAIDPLVGVLGVVTGVSGRSDLPPGSEVTVTQQLVGGGVAVLGVTTTDANGDWNLIGLNIALLNLANVSAEAQDAYGNSTTATLAWTDNTPPVLDVTINALSNDSSPVVSGTTDIGVGKKVIVTFTDKVGVSYVEEAIVDSNGNFSVAVSAVLPEGSYSVKVVAVDASGLVTEVLGAGVIDSVAPILTLDVLGTQGDATPLISGTSTEPVGSKVSVMVTDATNTPYLYEATVVAGGTWSIEVTDGLVNGVFSVTINASDSAGNPAVAVTSTGVINLSLPVIDITPLMVSNNTSPIIEGSSGLAQGTVVTLTVSQVGEADQVITVIVDANGNWTTQAGDISGLVEGSFNISVSAEDGVGNSITSNHSASIDLIAPSVIDFEVDYFLSGLTKIAVIGFHGTTDAEPGTTVTLDNSLLLGLNVGNETAIVQSDGSWAFTNIDFNLIALGVLGLGLNDVRIIFEDEAGNTTIINGGGVEVANVFGADPASDDAISASFSEDSALGEIIPNEISSNVLSSDTIDLGTLSALSPASELIVQTSSVEPLGINDVIINEDAEQLIALNTLVEGEGSAIAYRPEKSGGSINAEVPTVDVQNQSEEMIKHLIEASNNQTDI